MHIRLLCLAFVVLFVQQNMLSQEDVLRPNGRTEGEPSKPREKKSKSSWILGLEAGVNFNMYSETVTGAFDNSQYRIAESASGLSALAGIFVGYEIAPKWTLGARLLYDPKYISNTNPAVVIECEQGLFPTKVEGGINSTLVEVEGKFEASISYLTIQPLIQYAATPNLFIQFGPVLQFAIDSLEYTNTQTFAEGSECTFDPGTPFESRVRSLTLRRTPDNAFRFGLDLGVGYKIALAKNINLVPRVGYQFMLTPFQNDTEIDDDSRPVTEGLRSITVTDSMLRSLQASLSLWFTL